VISATNLRLARAQGFELTVDEFLASQGKLVAIVGPNGSGKSTLCSALCGAEKSVVSSVAIHGESISTRSATALAQSRAVLPQSTPMSADFLVSDVVLLGAHAHAHRGKSAIDSLLAQITEWLELQSFLDRRISTLSGGQQQRVHIARCLLQGLLADKAVMLFDEPVAALDVAWQHRVMQLLAGLAKSATVVTVLHELNLALQYAGDVYVLKNGSIVARGNPAEVLTEDCLTATYGWPFSVLKEPQHLIYSLPNTQK
jgi:iron complex transport system ATP-binding protein